MQDFSGAFKYSRKRYRISPILRFPECVVRILYSWVSRLARGAVRRVYGLSQHLKKSPTQRYALLVAAFVIVCIVLCRRRAPSKDLGTCTYKTCPRVKDGTMNIHLIPYSHVDVGWLDTVDDYYTGDKNARGCVRCILNSTINQLLVNRSRRFSFVEMKYFSRYWEDASPGERDVIRQLLAERRLEILGGAWVMGDAAVTLYNDFIDQQTLGLQFIHDTLGPCALPRCVWHMDQFGHSREYASLLAQMGFDALFVSRVPQREKEERKISKSMEFLWLGSPKNLKRQSAIFTHVAYETYDAPRSYLLEAVKYRIMKNYEVGDFVTDILAWSQAYKTNHLMVTMGSDFGYRNSEFWYRMQDELISGINSMGCKQMMIFAKLFFMKKMVDKLRDVMGVMQHHDAITGTQKQVVADDYNRMLSEGILQCQSVMSKAYSTLWLIEEDRSYSNISSQFCPDLNISSCPVSEYNDMFCVSVYNSLGWSVTTTVRFPITKCSVVISHGLNDTIPFQLVPVAKKILEIPERNTRAETEVIFQVTLEPMAYKTFSVQQIQCKMAPQSHKQEKKNELSIENEYLKLYFSRSSGRLLALRNKETKKNVRLTQDFAYYESYKGGAYSFTAASFKPVSFSPSGPVLITKNKGSIVEEIHQTFNESVSQVVRLYRGEKFAEFQWIVGPMNSSYEHAVQVISRYTSDLNSGQIFYTDSNGRETMERRRYNRTLIDRLRQDTVSSNYYPVTSSIYIQDHQNDLQLTILPDRCQGGSSLNSGQIELMVHRRTFTDDNFGVEEPLNELGRDNQGVIYTGKHFVCLDTIERSAGMIKHLSKVKQLEPTVMFTPVSPGSKLDSAFKIRLPNVAPVNRTLYLMDSGPHMDPSFNFTFQSFLVGPLPDNIHVVTLDYFSQESPHLFLLRLEHIYEVDEHPVLSEAVMFSLDELFINLAVVQVWETTLGVYLNPNTEKLNWTSRDLKSPQFSYSNIHYLTKTILLRPMEIKTFILKVVFDPWKIQEELTTNV
ncbi:lysosomal alpha-mannosidase-like isoform X2 [Biomphalaria glabrata]|uniref:Lysosomal alpha-mannosidase-like isoform X2 n=1 Tax=Biomphalaria glabrata TaxID=6526 RepID=A0A9W2ZRH0_BIOGL|nr:lysosomal alpha-mannosidase-like isoform X2 [Biomphalaria glabrata]